MLARRDFLALGGCVVLPVGALASGCKRAPALPASCQDTSGLTEAERKTRATLGYVDRAPTPEKSCHNCQRWIVPPRDSECGHCKLLKGPIHPAGTCKAFAARS